MSLTPKQARFVDEYLIDLNAKQAAIRAGYSAKSAEQLGYQLLQKTSVAEAVALRQAEQAEQAGITADRIVAELGLIAFAGIGHKHVPTKEKRCALVDLGKHLGMFVDRSETKVSGEVHVHFDAADARL